ncbi:MAG: glycine-rich domain-containing protein [Candidatus Porifericomitaceae bacterium WSBS_2022_MAG_OTU9]
MLNIINLRESDKGKDYLLYPDAISSERVGCLLSKGIMLDIAKVDLEMVKMKLGDSDEGMGWEEEMCDKSEVEYKRFLHLSKVHGRGIVPTKVIDTVWHYHILDTHAYCTFSEEVFGGYFHHYPYFGMRGEQDAKDLELSFYKTKDLYEKAFGEPMGNSGETDCWHDCEGRCHNECKSIE